jgi:hypothetical protein
MSIEIQQLVYEARCRGSKLSTNEGRLVVSGPDAPALIEREAEVVQFLDRHAVLETIQGLDMQVWVIRPEVPPRTRTRTKRVTKDYVTWGIKTEVVQ